MSWTANCSFNLIVLTFLNIKRVPRQCDTNIFYYLNIQILGGEYFVLEYEYLFSSVQIYLIFVFSQIDLMNIYLVHIRYGFGGYLANIQCIFKDQAQNIHFSNMNISIFLVQTYSVLVFSANLRFFPKESKSPECLCIDV